MTEWVHRNYIPLDDGSRWYTEPPSEDDIAAEVEAARRELEDG